MPRISTHLEPNRIAARDLRGQLSWRELLTVVAVVAMSLVAIGVARVGASDYHPCLPLSGCVLSTVSSIGVLYVAVRTLFYGLTELVNRGRWGVALIAAVLAFWLVRCAVWVLRW